MFYDMVHLFTYMLPQKDQLDVGMSVLYTEYVLYIPIHGSLLGYPQTHDEHLFSNETKHPWIYTIDNCT